MQIYNSMTRKKEPFVPLHEGKVGIYACGPTVYNFFHIGNARPFIVFDVLRRYLEYRGYEVTFVQNFTDIDDKMIRRANEEGVTVAEIAERYIAEYFTDAKALGIRPATVHPRATEHIPQIIALIQRLIDKARSLWNLEEVSEITVEANPDDITEHYLDELARTDINRLSFGVQSFIDRDLKLLGRRHNAQQAVEAIRAAQAKGFGNISLDLIFGIPGMSLREWENNVLRAVILGVQHISAYCLTISDNTVFGDMAEAGTLIPASDEICEEQFMICHRILTDSGFCHYEISNYARGEEFRSLHNWAYWCGKTYLGLGPSAHSYDGDQRIYSVNNLEKYIELAGTDRIYGREILSRIDKYNEYIMTALRTDYGIRRDALSERFGFKGLLYFEYCAGKFLRNGLIVREGNVYRIPPEKLMVSNSIISDLFYIEE